MSFLSRYEELGAVFDPEAVRLRPSLRVNSLKVDEEVLVKRLRAKGVRLEKVPDIPFAYWYEADFSLGATQEYLQGYYYLQELASQLSPLALSPRPGDHVLDMAAAPGSKTTQMAQFMRGKGDIVALDSDAYRLASLRNNVERLGVVNVIMCKKDARFAFDLGMVFDRILLDAPCSGNFCVQRDFFSVKDLAGIRSRAKLQKELLKSAYRVLAPSGALVYSTCSLEPEEDELIINWFLKRYPDMRLVDTGLSLGDPGVTSALGNELDSELSLTRRFWPHRSGTQGFFIAKLVRS